MARIWIVDDEPLLRRAVESVLEEVGHETASFGDAEGLYEQLIEQAEALPDLLILDHMLPDEDGAQIVHALRERPQYREIPVLFVTAVSGDSAERLVDLAPVLRKPFDFRDLVEAVDERLSAPTAETSVA